MKVRLENFHQRHIALNFIVVVKYTPQYICSCRDMAYYFQCVRTSRAYHFSGSPVQTFIWPDHWACLASRQFLWKKMFTRVFKDDSHATEYFPLQKKKAYKRKPQVFMIAGLQLKVIMVSWVNAWRKFFISIRMLNSTFRHSANITQAVHTMKVELCP